MKKIHYIIIAIILIAIGFIIYGSLAKADIYGSSLVGWWRFDTNDDLNGVTLDRSGSGNNGTLKNIATSTFYSFGKIGQGFDFDGTNDYVDLGNPTSLQITGAITFGAWVKFDTTNTIDDIISKDGGASDRGYRLNKEAEGTLSCNVAIDATNVALVVTATTPSANVWYHIICVYTPSTSIAIFINGVQGAINITSIPASQRNAVSGPNIGLRHDTASGYMDGNIDDVRVYNRALSAREVKMIYNMGR